MYSRQAVGTDGDTTRIFGLAVDQASGDIYVGGSFDGTSGLTISGSAVSASGVAATNIMLVRKLRRAFSINSNLLIAIELLALWAYGFWHHNPPPPHLFTVKRNYFISFPHKFHATDQVCQ
jgi:hypothetical protein